MKSKHVKYDWVITRVLSFLEKTLKKTSIVFLCLVNSNLSETRRPPFKVIDCIEITWLASCHAHFTRDRFALSVWKFTLRWQNASFVQKMNDHCLRKHSTGPFQRRDLWVVYIMQTFQRNIQPSFHWNFEQCCCQ